MKQPNSTSNPPYLQAIKLSCQRDEQLIFSNLSFALAKGSLLQLEGPNGAGKTTLLRVIAGLLPLAEGQLNWQGLSLSKADIKEDFNQNLVFLGHQPGIKPELSPLENLSWFAGLEGITDEVLLVKALAEVGLAGYEDQASHQLSAGQKRRVALARLLITQRKLWLLDEPFTALDKQAVINLKQLFQHHCSQGGSIILTSHHALEDLANLHKLTLGAS